MNELMRKLLFLPEQGTALAAEVDHLHYFVITVTMAVSAVLGLTAVFFMVRYRRRRPNQPTPHIEPTVGMEVLFIGIPITIFLLWFRIGYQQFIDLDNPPADSMDVYVMGKKWMWKFAYPEGPNGLSVLRVPANRNVRLLLTSRDVIHSFYVPGFRIKKDALPGRYTQVWFNATKAGRYPVFCAEYCGTGHSTMRAEIEVMEPEDFEKWVESEKRGPITKRDTPSPPLAAPTEMLLAAEGTAAPSSLKRSDMVTEGQRLAAEHGCLKCHSVDGTAHIGPTWKDMYHRKEKMADGQVIDIDESYITQSMMEPKVKQVSGFPLVMPSYQGELSGPESAAIVEYIKSLRTAEEPPPPPGPVYQPGPNAEKSALPGGAGAGGVPGLPGVKE